jgi:hypothetical protein
MRKILLVCLLGLLASAAPVSAQPVALQNQLYRIEVAPAAIVVTRLDAPGLTREIRPELTLQFTAADPGYTDARAEGTTRVAAWKASEAKVAVRDFWSVGTLSALRSTRVVATAARTTELEFPPAASGRLTLTIRLDEGSAPPAFTWRLTATQPGWFSVGFTGVTPRDPASLDFLYQPLVWSWKRFPVAPVLTPENFAATAAVFTNVANATEGLAPDVAEIPYRFATFANSRFGLGLRDAGGQARPVVFAPVLGGAESKLAPGDTRSFTVRYFLQPGDWYAGLNHFYRAIAGYRNERQNATGSLNETFERIVDYAMDDVYGGWVAELKGADYRFDVPSAVKNVAASHVLSVALTTGDAEIYRRRGLPMLEYLLSREKYLYADDEKITTQSPSHLLRGPAVELGELTALHELTGGRDSVYARELARLFGHPRQLNLNTETGAASWQDFLARYRIGRDPSDLRAAREGADRLIADTIARYPADFTTNAGLRDNGAAFATDFTPPLYDLTELFEVTGERRYLDAALTAARQLLLWQRSNPMAPATIITANPGGLVPGVFPGRRHGTDKDFKPYDTSTAIPEQRVEAWRTSLVGTLPEQPGTYRWGPVMLAHHAAWLLRLSQLSGDPLLAEAANNAVIGRYANFPGYYFTSLETTVYQQPDYPLHSFFDVKYNAIFYNHIWPHIALIQDFLVSEAFAKSRGRVNFPSAYAPGYAFLTSKVYGHRAGEVFGDPGVRLWLPRRALRSSVVALNHVFGAGPDATYLILSNTSPAEVTADLTLDADVLRLDAGQVYQLTFRRPDGPAESGELRDGRLRVRVPAGGLVSVKIHGLKNLAALPVLPATTADRTAGDAPDFFRQPDPDAAGTVTGMILRFGARTDAFIYTDRTEKQVRKATLRYRIGDAPEAEIVDTRYPYEFSVPLADAAASLQARLVVEDLTGSVTERALPKLKTSPRPAL